MVSPTQRSLALLRKDGYTAQVVERWNPHAMIRQDLFGCIDILGIRSMAILGVQACAASSASARVKKSMAEPKLKTWLLAGGYFVVQAWGKKGARGARKTWQCRSIWIKLDSDNNLTTNEEN